MKRLSIGLLGSLLAFVLLFELFPRTDLVVSSWFFRPPPLLTGDVLGPLDYLERRPDVAKWGRENRPTWNAEQLARWHYWQFGRLQGTPGFQGAEPVWERPGVPPWNGMIDPRHPRMVDWIGAGFHINEMLWSRAVYEVFIWVPRVILFVLCTALITSFLAGVPALIARRRQIAFLILAFVIGPGLLIDATLKEHSGRARPWAVQEFGGEQRFTPALRISDQCTDNCSFPSGHAAAGFAVSAFGLVVRGRWRRRWFAAGIALGTASGAVRIMQGGHFLSDVVFSFYFTALGILVAALLFRVLRIPVGSPMYRSSHQTSPP